MTLLFTDVEGSTQMLRRLGRDRYVGALTEHRRLLRAAFARHGGVEVEMQGDSFLFVFSYARDAAAAAADGQRALAGHAWPDEPIRVRIGLHTGEPVVQDDLYAGLDVHRAARVMSAASGGQVLLSARTADLVEGELAPDLGLVPLGRYTLKDFEVPEALTQLRGEGLETEARVRAPAAETEAQEIPSRRRSRLGLLVALAAATVGAVVAAVVLLTRGSAAVSVPSNSVAAIDPGSNRVVAAVSLEPTHPTALAAGEGTVWVASATDGTLTEIDADHGVVTKTLTPADPPGQVTVAGGSVWIESGTGHGLFVSRLPLADISSASRIVVPACYPPPKNGSPCYTTRNRLASGITAGAGAIWAVGDAGQNSNYNEGIVDLARIDPERNRLLSDAQMTPLQPVGIAVGGGYAWVPGARDDSLSYFNLTTGQELHVTVGVDPSAVVFGNGTVWVTTLGDDSVWLVRPQGSEAPKLAGSIRVGHVPVAVAFAEGAAWVANHDDGTVSRIDARSGHVTATIPLGRKPVAIAAGDGRIWVAVQGPPGARP